MIVVKNTADKAKHFFITCALKKTCIVIKLFVLMQNNSSMSNCPIGHILYHFRLETTPLKSQQSHSMKWIENYIHHPLGGFS